MLSLVDGLSSTVHEAGLRWQCCCVFLRLFCSTYRQHRSVQFLYVVGCKGIWLKCGCQRKSCAQTKIKGVELGGVVHAHSSWVVRVVGPVTASSYQDKDALSCYENRLDVLEADLENGALPIALEKERLPCGICLSWAFGPQANADQICRHRLQHNAWMVVETG